MYLEYTNACIIKSKNNKKILKSLKYRIEIINETKAAYNSLKLIVIGF